MSLTERYNDRYVGDETVRLSLIDFVRKRWAQPIAAPPELLPIMILEGPAGCGKMTAVRDMARILQAKVLVVNEIDFTTKGKDFQAQLYGKCTAHRAFETQRPIIVLQHLEQWKGRLSDAMKVLAYLGGKQKSKKPKANKKAVVSLSTLVEHRIKSRICNPIIITTSDEYYKERLEIRKLGNHLSLKPPPLHLQHIMLDKMSTKLELKLSKDEIHRIAQIAQGDIRSMIILLENGCHGSKDRRELGYFELSDLLFQPLKVADTPDLRYQIANHDSLMPLITENYLDAATDLKSAMDVSDMLSLHDMIQYDSESIPKDLLVQQMVVVRPQKFKFRPTKFPNRRKTMSTAEAREYLRESSVSYRCRYETPFQARQRLDWFPWTEQPSREEDPGSYHTFISRRMLTKPKPSPELQSLVERELQLRADHARIRRLKETDPEQPEAVWSEIQACMQEQLHLKPVVEHVDNPLFSEAHSRTLRANFTLKF